MGGLDQVGEFVRKYNISLDDVDIIKQGAIKQSRYSDESESFVDEQILAYTFTVCQANDRDNAGMYFEVTDEGVVSFAQTCQD